MPQQPPQMQIRTLPESQKCQRCTPDEDDERISALLDKIKRLTVGVERAAKEIADIQTRRQNVA